MPLHGPPAASRLRPLAAGRRRRQRGLRRDRTRRSAAQRAHLRYSPPFIYTLYTLKLMPLAFLAVRIREANFLFHMRVAVLAFIS
jgi:hypothetical protein